jgi:thiol-disulfide isomerase/thioredoxin
MPSPQRWTQLLLLAAAISAAGAATACQHRAPVPDGDVAAGLTLPAMGDQLDTDSLLGKPTLVVFVSPTCPHCVTELPLAQDAARTGDANVVAVFVVGNREAAAAIVQTAKFTGPVLFDDGTLRRAYEITGVPYTLVLRPDGHASDALIGTQSAATLQGAIAAARRPG